MKILGIDPGTRNCGYAVIEKQGRNLKLIEAGLIKIKTKILQEQIVEMTEGFDLLFKKHKIDEVSIEDMFYAFNPKTVIKYTPLQVKQAVTGNGKAQKEQVAFMVKRLLGIKKEIKPLDITDAIAIALTHAQRV